MKYALLPTCLLFGAITFSAGSEAQQSTDIAEPPSHEVLLAQLSGDSQSRLQAMRFVGPALRESPEQFFPALTKCMEDEDIRVQRSAVIYVGQYMIWHPAEGKAQDPRAIAWLQEQTHNEDYRVVYNCVYYGLSTVEDKSDELIDRLLDIVLMRERTDPRSVLQRVAWGCGRQPDKTARRVRARLDDLDPQAIEDAEKLTDVYRRITKRYPQSLDRFAAKGVYLIPLAAKPSLPNDEREVEIRLRERLGNDAIEKLRCKVTNGKCFCLVLIKGLGNYAAAMNDFSDSREFEIGYDFPPYSVDQLGMDKVLSDYFDEEQPAKRPREGAEE